MGMYDDVAEWAEHSIEIDGYPFYPEEIDPDESFNRRETVRESVLGGTEIVTRGAYVCRKYSFTTYITVPEGHPEAFDDVFMEMVSKPCEVISPYMGGKFMAEVIIQKVIDEDLSPTELGLDIEITEIPDEKSLIPNDTVNIPEDKL